MSGTWLSGPWTQPSWARVSVARVRQCASCERHRHAVLPTAHLAGQQSLLRLQQLAGLALRLPVTRAARHGRAAPTSSKTCAMPPSHPGTAARDDTHSRRAWGQQKHLASGAADADAAPHVTSASVAGSPSCLLHCSPRVASDAWPHPELQSRAHAEPSGLFAALPAPVMRAAVTLGRMAVLDRGRVDGLGPPAGDAGGEERECWCVAPGLSPCVSPAQPLTPVAPCPGAPGQMRGARRRASVATGWCRASTKPWRSSGRLKCVRFCCSNRAPPALPVCAALSPSVSLMLLRLRATGGS